MFQSSLQGQLGHQFWKYCIGRYPQHWRGSQNFASFWTAANLPNGCKYLKIKEIGPAVLGVQCLTATAMPFSTSWCAMPYGNWTEPSIQTGLARWNYCVDFVICAAQYAGCVRNSDVLCRNVWVRFLSVHQRPLNISLFMFFWTSDVRAESLEGPGKAMSAQKIPTLMITNSYNVCNYWTPEYGGSSTGICLGSWLAVCIVVSGVLSVFTDNSW